MRPDPLELSNGRSSEQDRPMGRVQGRQQRETVIDQLGTIRDQELTATCNDRSEAGQLLVAAIWNLKHREAPDPPSRMTLVS